MRLKRTFGISLAALLVGIAVGTELAKPPAERTWTGRISGLVPYDLRPPTLQRFRDSWWDPDGSSIITRQAFGVGWTVNVGRLARLVGLA